MKAFDWDGVSRDLDARGSAVLEHLVGPNECRALAALYQDDALFRSRVVMARHGFGRGEYKYFAYPLPHPVQDLRTAIYPIWFRSRIVGTRFWGARFAIPLRTWSS